MVCHHDDKVSGANNDENFIKKMIFLFRPVLLPYAQTNKTFKDEEQYHLFQYLKADVY